jgi:hypothetical protein
MNGEGLNAQAAAATGTPPPLSGEGVATDPGLPAPGGVAPARGRGSRRTSKLAAVPPVAAPPPAPPPTAYQPPPAAPAPAPSAPVIPLPSSPPPPAGAGYKTFTGYGEYDQRWYPYFVKAEIDYKDPRTGQFSGVPRTFIRMDLDRFNTAREFLVASVARDFPSEEYTITFILADTRRSQPALFRLGQLPIAPANGQQATQAPQPWPQPFPTPYGSPYPYQPTPFGYPQPFGSPWTPPPPVGQTMGRVQDEEDPKVAKLEQKLAEMETRARAEERAAVQKQIEANAKAHADALDRLERSFKKELGTPPPVDVERAIEKGIAGMTGLVTAMIKPLTERPQKDPAELAIKLAEVMKPNQTKDPIDSIAAIVGAVVTVAEKLGGSGSKIEGVIRALGGSGGIGSIFKAAKDDKQPQRQVGPDAQPQQQLPASGETTTSPASEDLPPEQVEALNKLRAAKKTREMAEGVLGVLDALAKNENAKQVYDRVIGFVKAGDQDGITALFDQLLCAYVTGGKLSVPEMMHIRQAVGHERAYMQDELLKRASA